MNICKKPTYNLIYENNFASSLTSQTLSTKDASPISNNNSIIARRQSLFVKNKSDALGCPELDSTTLFDIINAPKLTYKHSSIILEPLIL